MNIEHGLPIFCIYFNLVTFLQCVDQDTFLQSCHQSRHHAMMFRINSNKFRKIYDLFAHNDLALISSESSTGNACVSVNGQNC